MRYTKYQYKKNNNRTKFITSLVMTLVAAGVVGLILFKIIITFLMPLDDERINELPEESQGVSVTEVGEEINFEFIQCGYFGNEDNAKQSLSRIGSEYSGFIIKEGDKFRVSAGIFTKEQGDKISDELRGKGIDNAKVKYTLNSGDKIQGQIAAITDGYLSILIALKNKEVKGIDTRDFKTWINELPKIDEGENFELLADYKGHITELEDELKHENITQEYEYIYKILSKFSKS